MVDITFISEVRIPTERVSGLISRIERINEKLTSSGVPTIKLDILSEGMEKIKTGLAAGMAEMTTLRLNRQVEESSNQVSILAVSQLNNTNDGFETHRFFGQLTEAQINAVSEPKNSPNFCDHCETVRLRSKMYTVQVGDKVSRVGTSCLDEFSGMKIMPWARAMDEADKVIDRFALISPTDMKSILKVTVDNFLEEAFLIIEKSNYEGLTTQEYNLAVSSEAYLAASVNIQNDTESKAPEHIKKQVEQVKKYILGIEIDPSKRSVDYYLNLRNVVKHGHITSVESNLLASSIRSMKRDLKREKDLESKKDLGNCFIGKQKERLALKNLVVESVYYSEGRYGYTSDIKLRDSDNNFYSWKASGYIDINANDTIHLVGTIKGHENWDSKKYGKIMFDNQIARCKIMSEEDIDAYIDKESKKKDRKNLRQQSTNNDMAM